MKPIAFFLLLCLLLGSPLTRAEEKKPADPDEVLLRRAGIGIDEAGLLAYLRKYAERDGDLRNIDGLVRQLGDRKFGKRDEASAKLAALGLPALPALRKATNDRDLEIVRRSRKCIDEISSRKERTWIGAAARILLKRSPAGTGDALLAVLPYGLDEPTEETIWFGLDALAERDAKVRSALMPALNDLFPARRALAACLLSRLGDSSQKGICRALLGDPVPMVRLRGAQGLLAAGEKEAIPILIALLDQTPIDIAWQSEELLCWAACSHAPKAYVGVGRKKDRQSARSDWENWWKKNKEDFTLATLKHDHRRPGLLFIGGEGGIWLMGCDGKPHCHFDDFKGLMDVLRSLHDHPPAGQPEEENRENAAELARARQESFMARRSNWREVLPNGNFLAVRTRINPPRVVEIDRNGGLVWDCDSPTDQLYDLGTFLKLVRLGFSAPRPMGIDLQSPLYLASFLDHVDPHQRSWSAARLGDLGPKAAPVAGALVERLADPDQDTRQSAAHALQKIGAKGIEPLVEGLSHCRGIVRSNVAQILGTESFRQEKRHILPLAGALSDPDPAVRRSAADALRWYGTADPAVVASLIKAARDADPVVRENVVSSLGSFARAAEKVVPVLCEALGDEKADVVMSAAVSLGRIGPRAKPAVPALLKVVKGNNLFNRGIALTALGRIGRKSKEAVPVLLALLQDETYRDCWSETIVALGWMRSDAATAVPQLIRFLQSKEPALKEQAAEALGRIGPVAKAAVPALKEVARETGDAAEAAKRALRKINGS